jgi:acyl-CoA synthetase (AMP-forming)/AMP-acid ligase II
MSALIAFLDELPKTATGKIQRFKLREPRLASFITGGTMPGRSRSYGRDCKMP